MHTRLYNTENNSFNKIRILGDPHGEWGKLLDDIDKNPQTLNFVVGDIGFGFSCPKTKVLLSHLNFPYNHKNLLMLSGNHDDYKYIEKHPRWAGKFGYLEDLDLFWCGGAFSPDLFYRTRDRDWWIEEELTTQEFEQAFNLYKETGPSIVITHDGPWVMTESMGFRNNSRTQEWLQKMWEYKPSKRWYLGHYHTHIVKDTGSTLFTVVPANGKVEHIL